MRKALRARLVASSQAIDLRPGVVTLVAPSTGASVKECFLCTAPVPRQAVQGGHKDACDAYLSGFVHGVMSLVNAERPVPLCVAHETQLCEMLVVQVQDVETYKKLGIETRVT